MPMERPMILASAKRRIENAIGAEFALQTRGGFEYAALPFHGGKLFFAAAIRDVFAEDDDALVVLHFVNAAWPKPFRPWF